MNRDLLRKTLDQFVEYCSERPTDEHMINSEKNMFVYPTSDGLLESRVTDVGIFTMPAGMVYLTDEVDDNTSGFVFRLPKIPSSILDQTVSLFEKFMSKSDAIGSSTLEAFVQIFWNPEREEYFIHVPEQIVSVVKVDYVNDQDIIDNNVFVMDIHSHNNMSAFFSGTDDSDEKSSRLYGVVGVMGDEYPQASFRVGVAGKYKYIDVLDVFEAEGEFAPTEGTNGKNVLTGINRYAEIPEEWADKIKVKDNELQDIIAKIKRAKSLLTPSRETSWSSDDFQMEFDFDARLAEHRSGGRSLGVAYGSSDLVVADFLDTLEQNWDETMRALVAETSNEYDFYIELLYCLRDENESLFRSVINEFAGE